MLKKLVLASSLGIAMVAPAGAEVLKLSHFVPTVHGLHSDFVTSWVQDVKEASGGELDFQVFPGGSSFGDLGRQFEQVNKGITDVGFSLAGVPRDRLPRTTLIELPLLTQSREAATTAIWAIQEQYLADEFDNIKPLALFTDCSFIHTSEKVVNEVDDLEGLRIRTATATVSKIVEAAGGVPVALPPGQVYENIEKGVVDGAVFPWDPMASFKLAEVMNSHLETVVYCGVFWFGMNQATYDGLSDAARAAVDANSGAALVAKFEDWFQSWGDVGLEAVNSRGSTITKLDEANMDEWRARAEPIIEQHLAELEAAGVADAREVFAALQAEIAKAEAALAN